MLIVNGKQINHNTKKYVQDNDCHWYVIHKDDIDLFYDLLEKSMENDYTGCYFEEFEKRFDNGITGGAMDLLDNQIKD